ncbi:hypothetical protein Hanom_Chr10g00892821 [Helianthus anomalus]
MVENWCENISSIDSELLLLYRVRRILGFVRGTCCDGVPVPFSSSNKNLQSPHMVTESRSILSVSDESVLRHRAHICDASSMSAD